MASLFTHNFTQKHNIAIHKPTIEEGREEKLIAEFGWPLLLAQVVSPPGHKFIFLLYKLCLGCIYKCMRRFSPIPSQLAKPMGHTS